MTCVFARCVKWVMYWGEDQAGRASFAVGGRSLMRASVFRASGNPRPRHPLVRELPFWKPRVFRFLTLVFLVPFFFFSPKRDPQYLMWWVLQTLVIFPQATIECQDVLRYSKFRCVVMLLFFLEHWLAQWCPAKDHNASWFTYCKYIDSWTVCFLESSSPRSPIQQGDKVFSMGKNKTIIFHCECSLL